MAHRSEVDCASVHKIYQAARRGDQNVGATGKEHYLLVDRLAADNGGHAQLGAFRQGAEAVGDLIHKFAGGRGDQCLGGFRVGLAGLGQKVIDQRQAKSQGLSGTGLRQSQNVVTIQGKRNRLVLNRGGLSEIGTFECLVQCRGKAQHIKVEQITILYSPERWPADRS